MINNYPIIALEGPPGVGKTALLEELQKEGHPVVWEYVRYAGGHKNFPPLVSRTKRELEEKISYFTWLEKKRAEDITKYLKNQGYCLVDRSPLTILSLEYSLIFFYGSQVYTNLNLIAEGFQTAAKEGKIILPTGYVLLEAKFATVSSRLSGREEMPEVFLNQDSVKRIAHFYKTFLDSHKKTNSLTLTSDPLKNKQSDIEVLKAQIIRFLRKQQNNRKNSPLCLTTVDFNSF